MIFCWTYLFLYVDLLHYQMIMIYKRVDEHFYGKTTVPRNRFRNFDRIFFLLLGNLGTIN